jgi:16S rRNA G966 N2-methylase RsmD
LITSSCAAQYKGLWLKALRALDTWQGGLSEDAWVVVQIDPREAADEGLAHLARFDERVYGQTMLRLYRAAGV